MSSQRNVVLFLCMLLSGCGQQPAKEPAADSIKQAIEQFSSRGQSDETKKPAIEYAKYLPKTPLNEKVTSLLNQMDTSTGLFFVVQRNNLDDLFPDAVEPLLALAANPKCEGRGLPLACLRSGDLGPHAQRVAEFVNTAREDKDPEVRAAAISVTFARSYPEATDELLQSVLSKDVPEVRCQVIYIIANDENPQRSRLLLLSDALCDADDSVSDAAIDGLDELGAKVRPIVAELRKLLDVKDEYVRGAVIEALAVCGEKKDWETICAACRSNEIPIQYRGAKALFHYDPNDPKVVDMALVVFDAEDCSETRCQAAKVLSYGWPVQDKVVQRLADALHEADLPGEAAGTGETRLFRAKAACLSALQSMGPAAAAAIPKILSAPQREEFMHCDVYMRALRTIAPRHPDVLKYYKDRLNAGKFGLFDAEYLRALGDDAGQFADAIIGILGRTKKDRPFFVEELFKNLWLIRGIPAECLLPILLRELDDKETTFHGHVLKAIGAMGPKAAPATARLIKELNRNGPSNDFIRVCAVEALGKIGPSAKEAAPHLQKIFADPKAYRTDYNSLWHVATVALARIDKSELEKVLAALRNDLHQPNASDQAKAIYYAGKIGPPAAPLLDDIEKIAADRDHELFQLAVTSMIQIGREARGAKIAIADLQSSDDKRKLRGCAIAARLTEPEQTSRILPILRTLCRSRDKNVAMVAAGAIQAMTGEEAGAWDGCASIELD